MQTMMFKPGPQEKTIQSAKKGDVFQLLLHGLQGSPQIRDNPPRFRLLEDSRGYGHYIKVEILDPSDELPTHMPELDGEP